MTRFKNSAVSVACALLLGACGIAPVPKDIASYDFGPAAPAKAEPRLAINLVVTDVVAPAWMDNTNLHYRLAYVDPARPLPYANSRWVMAPAALLSQRLRAGLREASKAAVLSPADGVRAEHVLRLELEEFSQVFDSADKSRGVLRLQARLVRGNELAAQQSFNIEMPAPSANAEGGVRALAAASDEAGRRLADWLAANLRR
ncbi:MAG: ABC-type transport auxiliary lipoprotein family protein [Burkholderiales bacterium]